MNRAERVALPTVAAQECARARFFVSLAGHGRDDARFAQGAGAKDAMNRAERVALPTVAALSVRVRGLFVALLLEAPMTVQPKPTSNPGPHHRARSARGIYAALTVVPCTGPPG